MPRSVVGPFALEAPLGLDPRRTSVYRAVHMQQKKAAAVRVFSTPLGLTPEAKQDFARQIEELKELRHPGIVRCYGGGFDKKDAYLAYEWIEGESLDQLLQRRERLPWETALDYALQIAEAMQFAHEQGWLHNRLRPDKILICAGGLEVRVSDFRRDDAIWLTPLQSNPEQWTYQAPEILQDEPMRSERSDIYSLGAILYQMLTGQLLFDTTSTELLQASIQRTVPPNISSIALDCPVWLSTLIAQMLEKEPLKRPYTMAAVVMALNQALSRAAAGVSVAEHIASGFNPLQIKGDRKEAEKILGRKKAKKPFENPAPWLFNGTIALVGLFLGLILIIVWAMQPPDADSLKARAELLLADEDISSLVTARDNYLVPLLERFPDGPHAQWAQARIDEIDVASLERRIETMIRFRREMKSEAEQQLADAIMIEKNGDRDSAAEKYQAIITLMDKDPSNKLIIMLAQKRLKALEDQASGSDELSKLLTGKLKDADNAFQAGKQNEAKEIWQSIINLYQAQPDAKKYVDTAKKRLGIEEPADTAEALNNNQDAPTESPAIPDNSPATTDSNDGNRTK